MKKRADILLVELGLCASRALAQKLVLAGQVRTGPDAVVQKASDLYDPATTKFQIATPCPYVSRGAYKLLAALEAFPPPLAGLVALDIGASTGGFTDLLLQRGVRKVYAVDVGHGQLHPKLRGDPRVVCLEKVNARYLSATDVPEAVDLLVADVSFISLKLALPAPARRLRPGGWAFVLVKPQFEAGRAEVGKGGVVKEEAVRQRCIAEIRGFAESALGWRCLGVVPSPIKGPAGNQEYVAAFQAHP
ncbi:MAG: TlyA family RNA methyltransferase [Lentisphaeria bacterium]|jgi:23S rRNA (cytidine1920-2'-O)/16S rRNA (cytidine1409-2'-O)-methyltransferase